MLRLRKILLCNYPFYIGLFLALAYTLYFVSIKKYESVYDINISDFICVIKDITYNDDRTKYELFCDENIVGYYDGVNKEYELYDKVKIKGNLRNIKNNTVPNGFNYKKYLYYKKTYYLLNIDNIELISKTENIIYKLKRELLKRINEYPNSSNYLKAFILGDTSDVEFNDLYQSLGVSHLFAISGMHVTILSGIILKILKKIGIKELCRYIISIGILFLYTYLASFSPSVLRAYIFFALLSINKIYYFYVSNVNIFILTLCIVLFINPFFIYNIGFQYSFIISFYLIIYSKYLNDKNYIVNLFKVSLLAFLVSMPITIYNNSIINLFSVIYNLFYVPFINFIIFPLSLLTLFIPLLDKVLFFFINILERITLYFDEINFSKIVLYKPSEFILILYYLVINFSIYKMFKKRYFGFLILTVIIIIHYNYNVIFKDDYMLIIDVGQGDSILIRSNNKNVLIDTGNSGNEDKILRLLSSYGIRKLDALFITHGDYDHLGSSYEIVREIDIDKVYFNCNSLNQNEIMLIEILDKEKIDYGKTYEGDSFLFGNTKIYTINGIFEEENDASTILYVIINDKRILLTGDASIESEKYITDKYDIDVDFLKVGHHGSKTSTSEMLLKKITPEYAVISVGLNNLYHHPSKDVINRLNNYSINVFSTDVSGTILINFKKRVTILEFKP